MQTEPRDLEPAQVAAALADGWGIEARRLTYARVGAGSHHWEVDGADGRRWFATADQLSPRGHRLERDTDDVFASLRAAYTTAASLRDHGHEFVVSPTPDHDGHLLRRVTSTWALAVFPHILGETTTDGEWTDAGERERVAALLGRIHSTPAPNQIQSWQFEVPNRTPLQAALDTLGVEWGAGPFAKPVRQLLTASQDGVRRLLTRYDDVAAMVAAHGQPWVVTHGEPHSANVIRGDDGSWHLVDWDTVRLSPRERDLAPLVPLDEPTVAAYRNAAGPSHIDPAALELFQIWWRLAEIGEYVHRFSTAHDGTADDRACWDDLASYLPMRDL